VIITAFVSDLVYCPSFPSGQGQQGHLLRFTVSLCVQGHFFLSSSISYILFLYGFISRIFSFLPILEAVYQFLSPQLLPVDKPVFYGESLPIFFLNSLYSFSAPQVRT